jgi:protein O-GlcNAc transferase
VTRSLEAADAYRELGDRVAVDDPASAEVAYRRALDFEPTLADVHVRLADALVRLGRLCEADGQLRAARRLDPAHEGAARLTADLLLARGRLVEALDCLAGCAESGSPLLLTEYGDVLARIGLLDEAELAYGRALQAGECAETRTNLGLLLLVRGDREAALRQFERALELDPSAPEAAVNRANVLLELGRLDEAEALLEALGRGSDTRAPALWALAAVYEHRGDQAAARRARREAIGLWPALEQLGTPAEGPAPSDAP